MMLIKRGLDEKNDRKMSSTHLMYENFLRTSYDARFRHYKNELQRPEVWQPLMVVALLSIVQVFSGMSMLRAYVVTIFDDIFNHQSGNNASIDCQAEDRRVTVNEAYYSAMAIAVVRLIARWYSNFAACKWISTLPVPHCPKCYCITEEELCTSPQLLARCFHNFALQPLPTAQLTHRKGNLQVTRL